MIAKMPSYIRPNEMPQAGLVNGAKKVYTNTVILFMYAGEIGR